MAGGRVAHIKRIYQNDDPDSDIWVDVERIDQLTVIVAGRQRRRYTFDWDTIESGGQDSSLDKKIISDPNDESSTIEIPIRNSLRIRFPRAIYNHYFLNDATNQGRETHSRRVYHHDIEVIDGEPPSDPDIYRESLGNQDPEQYIDVEIIDAYWTKGDDSRDLYQRPHALHGGMSKGPRTVRDQRNEWVGTQDDPLLQDPIVDGDIEGGEPGFVPTENPGGVIDPPWRLDPLQNIVNVSWGRKADVFVSGASYITSDKATDIIRYLDFSKKTTNEEGEDIPQWEVIGQGPFTAGEFNVGAVYGGVYGNGIYVLVGGADFGVNEYGVIAISTDGISWQQVFTGVKFGENPTAVGSRVFGVVWDGKDFWAGYHESNNGDPAKGEIHEDDILLNSVDGLTWSETERHVMDIFQQPNPDYKQGLLAGKCSDKGLDANVTVRDANDNGVPGGIWDQNAAETVLIRPTNLPAIDYVTGGSSQHTDTSITRITWDVANDASIEETIDVGFPVYGVANAGGAVWVAVGGSYTNGGPESVYSVDDGETWMEVSTSTQSGVILAVMSKKKRDETT